MAADCAAAYYVSCVGEDKTRYFCVRTALIMSLTLPKTRIDHSSSLSWPVQATAHLPLVALLELVVTFLILFRRYY